MYRNLKFLHMTDFSPRAWPVGPWQISGMPIHCYKYVQMSLKWRVANPQSQLKLCAKWTKPIKIGQNHFKTFLSTFLKSRIVKSTKCTKSGDFNVLKIHIFKMIHFSCVEIPFALSDESSAPWQRPINQRGISPQICWNTDWDVKANYERKITNWNADDSNLSKPTSLQALLHSFYICQIVSAK